MKTCKKCREIISLDLADIINGKKAPKLVNAESISVGLCKECFNKKETIVIKHPFTMQKLINRPDLLKIIQRS